MTSKQSQYIDKARENLEHVIRMTSDSNQWTQEFIDSCYFDLDFLHRMAKNWNEHFLATRRKNGNARNRNKRKTVRSKGQS